jgi:hypothetical protein
LLMFFIFFIFSLAVDRELQYVVSNLVFTEFCEVGV